MSDADILLLSLEAEVAAARNADLSRLVESLQRHIDTHHAAPSVDVSTQTPQCITAEERGSMIHLDDALFDIADMLLLLSPSEAGMNLTARRDEHKSLSVMSQTVAVEMKRLRHVCESRIESMRSFSDEMKRELGVQMLKVEAQKQKLAIQAEKDALRCAELEATCRALRESNDSLRATLAELADHP